MACIVLYAALFVVVEIPAVQRVLARSVASMLENSIGARVEIGRVALGLFNKVVLSDVVVYDRLDKALLEGKRLSAKIEWRSLREQKVNIRTLELIDIDVNLYKRKEGEAPNYQFLIDTFASKDTTSSSGTDIRINSLIIRRTNVRYDEYHKPHKEEGFDASHLHVSNLNANISLKELGSDSINLRIRGISLKEAGGLDLQNLSMVMVAGRTEAVVRNFNVELPGTRIGWDSLVVKYDKPLGFDKSHLTMLSVALRDAYITPSDLSCFVPLLKGLDDRFALQGDISADKSIARMRNFALQNESGNIALLGGVNVSDWKEDRRVIKANIDKLLLTATASKYLYGNIIKEDMPEIITRIGNVSFEGNGTIYRNNYHLNGMFTTSVGGVFTDIGLYSGKDFDGKIIASSIDLKNLLANGRLGNTGLDVHAKGTIEKGKEKVSLNGRVSHFSYDGYVYKNIDINGDFAENAISGKLNLDDPNARLDIEGRLQGISSARKVLSVKADVANLNPGALRLTQKYGDNTTFNLNFTANAEGSNINNLLADLSINGLRMKAPEKEYELANLDFRSYMSEGTHVMKVNSDFVDAELRGLIEPSHIHSSFLSILSEHVPSLGIGGKGRWGNDFVFYVNVKKSDFFDKILALPIELRRPITLNGSLSDNTSEFMLAGFGEDVEVYGQRLKNFRISGSKNDSTTRFLLQSIRATEDTNVKFELDISGRDDKIFSHLTWDNADKADYYKGHLRAITNFEDVPQEGGNVAVTDFTPTIVTIYGSPWQVSKSRICVAPRRLIFDEFSISRDDQMLRVNGNFGNHADDAVMVTLKRIDLTYIFDLLNFHPVDFSGFASGRVDVGRSGEKLKIGGDIQIDSFAFNKEVMGTLVAQAAWNDKEKQVDIDATIEDGIGGKTLAEGYVSPAKDGLDLTFTSQNTTVGFLNYYLEDIFSNLRGTASGKCRLYGKFADLNVVGEEVINVRATAKALGVEYHISGDTLRMTEKRFAFDNVTVKDKHGKTGSVKGYVAHEHLRDMKYDFHLAADKLLCYEFDKNTDQSFYGTIMGTGTAHLYGGPGHINADIDIHPDKGSVFTYNASMPTEVNDDKLLVFYDKTPHKANRNKEQEVQKSQDDEEEGYTSDLRLNFKIGATPDAALQIIMDEKTGDYIEFHGMGDLTANYYNKGLFRLIGTYNVVDGLYKLSIQDVVRKDFKFQPGGTLTFRGDPYDGDLDLRATYTINSASLNELSSSQNFSNNTTKVDCILNIGGKAGRPEVSFDLDLPSVGEEEKQMVRNLISTDEEMNMQVMYLLSIGRFYTINYNSSDNSQGQSSSAVTSLLTSTLSSQLNDMLTSAINTSSWSFGTNVTTGRDGWSAMEVDGLLSGRLLNDRLLFNGNFGYRESSYYNTNFVGDFDLQWFITPRGNISLKAYSETNDRYFTKSSMTTQGIGIVFSKDFIRLSDLWRSGRKRTAPSSPPTATDSIK